MALSPCNRGLDYSGFRPLASQVKKDGAAFINRYSAGAGNTDPKCQWKLCGTGEIAAAVAAGLDFHANSEWYATRVTEGATAGAQDGAADLTFWKSRGLNKGASIYVSWDAYPDPTKWAAVDEYYAAYDAALEGYYFVDAYAGTPYLRHAMAKGLIRYGWRPNASNWSNDTLPYQPTLAWFFQRQSWVKKAIAATPAALWQTGNYWYGNNADENIILRATTGSHLQNSPVIVVKPTKAPAVTLGPYRTGGNCIASPDGHTGWFFGPESAQKWVDHAFQGSLDLLPPQ